MAFNSIYFSPFFLAQIPDTEEKRLVHLSLAVVQTSVSVNASRARCIDCVVPYKARCRSSTTVDVLLVWWPSIPWMSTEGRQSFRNQYCSCNRNAERSVCWTWRFTFIICNLPQLNILWCVQSHLNWKLKALWAYNGKAPYKYVHYYITLLLIWHPMNSRSLSVITSKANNSNSLSRQF
jgi:hypothetical protein